MRHGKKGEHRTVFRVKIPAARAQPYKPAVLCAHDNRVVRQRNSSNNVQPGGDTLSVMLQELGVTELKKFDQLRGHQRIEVINGLQRHFVINGSNC